MFTNLKDKVAERFAYLQTLGTLLTVSYDRDVIWQCYLDSFAEEHRQEHNCNCCKSFIRQVGGVIAIDSNNRVHTLWELEDVPAEFEASVRALHAYIKTAPIHGLFFHSDKIAGTDKSLDKVRNVIWRHFSVPIPAACHDKNDHLTSKSGELRTTVEVLGRGLDEIKPDAIQTVLELIDQNSLYRGKDYERALRNFRDVQEVYAAAVDQKAFVWRVAATAPQGDSRIKNTAIGTLLVDLSEGRDLEGAVKSFEQKVAPANYKRPSALVTPRMIQSAKDTLASLGLLTALDRRRLDSRDLSAAHALYTHRSTAKPASDVFAELSGEVVSVDVRKLSKVEEVSIADFIDKVLPNAKGLRVLFERQHLGNLVTLTGPTAPDALPLFKWDNSFGWSYSGGVGDSIKERVKAAGGNVEGWGRVSLSWYNFDDLDLHFRGGGDAIYYGAKRGRHGALDVDMNAGHGYTREPVENVHIPRALPDGPYSVSIHNFNARDSSDKGYEVEIEIAGEVFTFGSPTSPRNQAFAAPIEFMVRNGVPTFKGNPLSKTAAGLVKWGLKTGQWQNVRAVTLSPNHWDRPTGNKHWFFLLEGCVSDEATRPFLNEFLIPALDEHRKVTEILGGKIETSPTEGAELSGLGFSETIRTHFYVEVDGAFKRTLKVNI